MLVRFLFFLSTLCLTFELQQNIPLMKVLLISLALVCSVFSQSDLFTLVLHSKERGAACLDGSPPGLYIHGGTGANKNKFMIYFDSGGFCGGGSLSQTIELCYRRSSSSLGSTKNYKPQKSFAKMGLLSPIKEENPVFYDWTKIFVIYCDGSQYLGHRENPIPYKDATLYFRGSRNVLQQFRYLDQKHDFYNGDAIVITGVSAGGMATYEWSNYLMDHTKKAKVYGIPDSGFFITDYYSEIAQEKLIRNRAINLLNLINSKDDMPEPIQKCLDKPGLDIVDCLNSGNYIEFLRAPLLIVQSPYDAWSVENALAISCLKNSDQPFSLQNCDEKNRKIIEDYRTATFQYFNNMKKVKPDLSLWAPACVQHGYSDEFPFNDDHYKVNGLKLSEAVQKFIDNPGKPEWNYDADPWPSNAGCSGIRTFSNLKKESIITAEK